jgi:hypothetical protein
LTKRIEVQFVSACFGTAVLFVLVSVQVNSMTLYSLSNGDDQIVQVEMVNYGWMPQRPRLHNGWLRSIVGSALRSYLRRMTAQPRS